MVRVNELKLKALIKMIKCVLKVLSYILVKICLLEAEKTTHTLLYFSGTKQLWRFGVTFWRKNKKITFNPWWCLDIWS